MCRLATWAAAVGWATVVSGVVVAVAVQEHVDACGNPTDGRPSRWAFLLGAVAALLGIAVTSTASWLRVRGALPRSLALMVSGVTLACVGAVLALVVFGAHFEICF